MKMRISQLTPAHWWLMAAFAFGLTAVGLGIAYWQSETIIPLPTTELDVSELEPIQVDVKDSKSVPLRLTNNSDHPIRLVGEEAGCGPDGCVETLSKLPLTIPAGETVIVDLKYTPSGKGPIKKDFALFTDSPAHFRIVAKLRGQCRSDQSKEKTHSGEGPK